MALAEQEDDDSSANDSGRKTPSAPSGSRVAAGFYLFPLSSDENPTGRLVTKTNIAVCFATVARVGSR